jgi:hypothetical protein
VDAIALSEDEGFHRRVPLIGAMTKVDTTFEQSFHRYNCCHILKFSFAFYASARSTHSHTGMAAGTLRTVRGRV